MVCTASSLASIRMLILLKISTITAGLITEIHEYYVRFTEIMLLVKNYLVHLFAVKRSNFTDRLLNFKIVLYI